MSTIIFNNQQCKVYMANHSIENQQHMKKQESVAGKRGENWSIERALDDGISRQ